MENIKERALDLHKENKGKVSVVGKVDVNSPDDLSLVYTPGVAEVCSKIAENKDEVWNYTIKGNTVAVVSDGSAVLGLGNIGAEASMPVMEGKSLIFKSMANVDAFPICLDTQDDDEIINIVKKIAPVFGGINLEDIKAPRCFKIEEALQDLGIPVMHDDQHGTAVVTLAGIMNAVKVLDKKMEDLVIVINGAGAAGLATAHLFTCKEEGYSDCIKVKDIIVCDSKGAIYEGRGDLNGYKEEVAKFTNKDKKSGNLHEVLKGADVFVGVSKGNTVTVEDVKNMNEHPIIFAMANPIPEIMPDLVADVAGVIGTGRSDFPNQVNNSLAFPGIFRGALDSRATKITKEMKIAAAHAIADCVTPTKDTVLPYTLDKGVAPAVAKAVAEAAEKGGVCKK